MFVSVWRLDSFSDFIFLHFKTVSREVCRPCNDFFFSLVWDSPLCADVLLLDWHAGHLPQPHPHLDVSELQAQVLPQDGDSGSSLPRTRLWEQLEEELEEEEEGDMSGGGQTEKRQ